MNSKDRLLYLVFFIFHFMGISQETSTAINGRIVTREGHRDGILITNTTNGLYVLSDKDGYFSIQSKVSDSLKFTSPDYIGYTYMVNELDIKRNPVLFPLEQLYGMNRLDEIVITKIDSRSLGFTNKYTRYDTPAERKLRTATSGGMLAIDPFFNMLSGRASMLKKNLAYEKEDFRIKRFNELISRERLTGYYNIPADYIESFVYYASGKMEIRDLLENHGVDKDMLERSMSAVVFEFLEMVENKSEGSNKGVKE